MAEQDHDRDRAARSTSSAADSRIDPVEEDRYWRDNYIRRPYADETLSYDHYRPAYRYGWESRERLNGRRWDQVERELERGWKQNRGTSRLGWGDAKLAARDAWQRVDHKIIDAREAGRAAHDAETLARATAHQSDARNTAKPVITSRKPDAAAL